MSEQHSKPSDLHLSQYEKGVFVSYAWGGESEKIVNQIELALQMRGVKIIRDKHDLGFKGSVHQFMERIGQGNCVIVVISDEYLRSENCMFELMEIAAGKQFHDRIFPIVLGDADIYDPVKRAGYVKYWEDKRAELVEALRTLDPANLQGLREDIDLYDRIRDEISRLTSTLKDMNTLTPEVHRQGDYTILADAINDRILSNNQLPQKKILDRRFDAAMPKESQVGQTTEVRALIALTDSEGLRVFLPDYTVSHEIIVKEDVNKAGFPIEFPHDQEKGQLLPARVQVVIEAPDFEIKQPVQQILVPPDKDSGMLTFFLTPKVPLTVGRVSVKLYEDKDCTILFGSVLLTTKVSLKRENVFAIIWQLVSLPVVSPLAEALFQSQLGIKGWFKHLRVKTKVSPILLVAIIGAAATIFAAFIGITPAVYNILNTTPVPTSSPTACISADDILVRLHVWRGNKEIAILVPSEKVPLEPDLTVDLQVKFQSVSDEPLPILDCAWENANSTNTNIATEGKLLHTIGCNVDYQSGHTKIDDTLTLQLSQPSCSALPLYAFFISQ